MRLLLISPVFPPAFQYGGIPPIIFGLADALIALGHDCLVLSTNAGGNSNLHVQLEKPTIYQGVPVIYTSRWRQNSYFFAPHLIRHLKNLAPHYDMALVHGGWGYFNLAARLSLPKLSLPYLLDPQGLFDPWAFRHKFIKKLLYWHLVEKKNYLKASGIIPSTEIEASFVRQHFRDIPIRVIPNGINLDQFYPAPDREELGRLFPALASQPYILFLSRLHPKKGLDLLFPAFRRLLERCREGDGARPYLVVAGEGEEKYKYELIRMARQLDLGERVLFPGLVTGQAKLALLHHCAFMVLPSRGEGLPMAVLEALACGKPVIITPECYLPEVPQTGAGLEVELEMEKWAGAMAELWQSPDKGQKMGESAIRLVEEKFTWKRVAEQMVNFCYQILNKEQ